MTSIHCNRIALCLFLALYLDCKAQWQGLIEGTDNGLNNTVTALAVSGGELYAGGTFTASFSGAKALNRIARWNPATATWTQLGSGITSLSAVNAIAAANGYVWVGGDFTTITGPGTVNRIAGWDPVNNAWLAPLGSGANVGVDSTVNAIAVYGTRVYVAGSFTKVPGLGGVDFSPDYVAYWDTATSTWNSLAGANGPTAPINALAIADDGSVFVGGDGGVLKAWHNGTWSGLGSGVNGDVNALAIQGDELYVGGSFTSAGGQAATSIARWTFSSQTWSRLFGVSGEPWGTGQRVKAIAFNGTGQMYVTGYLAPKKLYTWLVNQWSQTLPPGGLDHPSISANGQALAVDRFGGKVYVGGQFESITTTPVTTAKYVAVWNDTEPFTLVDLGTLSANTYAYGFAVNNNGNAAGHSQVLTPTPAYRDHGFWYVGYLYDLGGNWSQDDASYVYGLNDSDVMVGTIDSQGIGSFVRAFRNGLGSWNLLDPVGGDRSDALAINNNNVAVGFSRNSIGVDRATRWPAGTPAGDDLLNLIPGGLAGYASYAYGINGTGTTVGKSRYSTANSYFHAFRCSAIAEIDATTDDLGMLPGGLESVANAINDRDQIAGSSDTAVAHHAFLNEPIPGGGRVFKDLGTTGGSNTSYAYAINNSAQIVGMSAGTDAFVWQRGTGMRKLQELLPAGSQWSLVSAEAINERGVIVGWGYNGGAYVRAFMLKP